MYGGEISNNDANVAATGSNALGGGGAVHNNGTFTMHNGKISGNTAVVTYWQGGGGVSVQDATFTMHDGEISYNKVVYEGTYHHARGGGVYTAHQGIFTMHNGQISGNIASANTSEGGGVFIDSNGVFDMRGGRIFDNEASSYNGGGVRVHGWNPAGGTFRMSGGVIYGDDAAQGLRNRGGGSLSLETNSYDGANSAVAWYGTFSNGTFSGAGDLFSTNYTVAVVNGVLVRPQP
jgi:hypothetical protein